MTAGPAGAGCVGGGGSRGSDAAPGLRRKSFGGDRQAAAGQALLPTARRYKRAPFHNSTIKRTISLFLVLYGNVAMWSYERVICLALVALAFTSSARAMNVKDTLRIRGSWKPTHGEIQSVPGLVGPLRNTCAAPLGCTARGAGTAFRSAVQEAAFRLSLLKPKARRCSISCNLQALWWLCHRGRGRGAPPGALLALRDENHCNHRRWHS